jgi:hypothetical protein
MFSLRILHKYDVAYLKCGECNSLQTERPYWTKEAYASSLSMLDTGAGQRNLSNLAASYSVSRVLRLKNTVDFGGGDGLLCRLLRDYGINCFVTDKFASATYASGFTTPNFSQPEMLLAFEVLEHFEDPRKDLRYLFNSNPQCLLLSTAVYSGQGPDWWYLAPDSGQHIFFYSREALSYIAKTYGYSLLVCSGYSLLMSPGISNGLARCLIRILLNKYALRLVSAGMRFLPATGVWKDHNSLRAGKP